MGFRGLSAGGLLLTSGIGKGSALGAVKLLPWIGSLAWWAATFVGVGATLLTKFGRREPWLQLAPGASLD